MGAGWCPMPKGAVLLGTLLSSVLLGSRCGAPSGSPPNARQAVQPNVLAISPTNIPAGSGGFTLSITGTGLGMTSQVNFGNAILAPSSATATNCAGSASCATLAVPVPAQDVAAPGMITVSVANSSLVSNPVLFAVMPQSSGVTGPPQFLVFSPLIPPSGAASCPLVNYPQNVPAVATDYS